MEEEETRLLQRIETCEECVSGILGQLFRHGGKIDLPTMEEVLRQVHSRELELRTELLGLQLNKVMMSFRHSKATGESRPLEDRDEE